MISEADQLKIIFEKTGQTSEDDMSFISSNNAVNYVNNLTKNSKCQIDLDKIFPDIDPILIEMLKDMLQVNPYMRPSASELLKHPIFDSMRFKDLEKGCQSKIELEVDSDQSYDYENEGFQKDKSRLDQYLKIITNEADEVHKKHLESIN